MQHLKPQLSLLSKKLLSPSTSNLILSQQIGRVRYQSNQSGELTVAEKIALLSAKQLKLSERAGRTKRDGGMTGMIPVFANHIRPSSTKIIPKGLSLRKRASYVWADLGNDIYTKSIKWKWRSALGKDWESKFNQTAREAYITVNQASASGDYSALSPISNIALIDAIKSQRSKLIGLRLSWKLHNEVLQDIICARQQEVMVQDEFVGQMAVRFITDQSLEIKDSEGKFVGKGRHSLPQRVTEFYIFQRDLWRPLDSWKLIKKVEQNDPIANPTQIL